MFKIYLFVLLIVISKVSYCQWISLTSGTTKNLRTVFASADGSTVWVGGEQSTLRKSTNGGSTWASQVLPGVIDVANIFFRPDNQKGWAASNGGIIYTIDGGTTWNQSSLTDFITAVHFFNDLEGLAASSDGNFYSSSDGGLNWTATNTGNDESFKDIQFGSDVNTAWLAGTSNGTDGVIYKLTRTGGVWTPTLQYTTNSGDIYDIAVINNSISWAVGPGNLILKTINGGTWTVQPVDFPSGSASGIAALDGNRAIALGFGGEILYTNDGSTWLDDNSGSTGLDLDISIISSDVGYIVGTGGRIFKTTNLVLPVSISFFTAQSHNKKVLLNWTTSMELNNTGFAVMRKTSTGNHDWEEVGFVRSSGNSNTTQSYSFTDEPKGGETFLYQLKQIDTDGKSTLSNILKVKIDIAEISLSNYPNPFRGQTTINYSLPKTTQVRLVIRNQFGQIVKTVVNAKQTAGNYVITVNANDLSSGIYYSELNTGSEKLFSKLSLQK